MPVSKEVTLKLVWESGSTAAVTKAIDDVKAKLASAFVGADLLSKIPTPFNLLKKSVVDTVGLLKSAGGTIFNLLAAPWRNFYDFAYRFIRWQITWGLIGLGAATEEFVRRSTSAFAEYELTIAKAVTTTGLLGAAAAAAKQEFMALGQELSMGSMLSATEIAKQFYWLTSAGLDVPQAGRVAPGVIALAQATQAAPEQTSALVMSAMAAFHMEVGQTDQIVNVFAASIGRTLLTLDTLATALPYVGASAYQAGLSFEEVNAALGLLANNGLKASRMGTGLRGVFAQLLNPTKEAEGILRQFGLSARDVNIQARGLYPVLDALAPILAARNQYGEPIGQGLISAIFGRRTTEAVNILITQRKEYLKLKEEITGTNRAYEMQSQILSTLAGQWAMLKNVGLALMIQFGGGLGGALKPWVMFLRDFGENLFGTGKAGQLGEKLGQWISVQLTKVGKWILSGDAAKWWDRLVAGAHLFWRALLNVYDILGQVYNVLKGLNTPENRAFFVAVGKWFLQLASGGLQGALDKIAEWGKSLGSTLQGIINFFWQLIPAGLAYLRIWVEIAHAKAQATAWSMQEAAFLLGWPLTRVGRETMKSGEDLMYAAKMARREATWAITNIRNWYDEQKGPPSLVNPIIDAHAAGGEKVASAIERAFAAAAGGGVGATAMEAATGAGGGGAGGAAGYDARGNYGYFNQYGWVSLPKPQWRTPGVYSTGSFAGYGDPGRTPWRARELEASQLPMTHTSQEGRAMIHAMQEAEANRQLAREMIHQMRQGVHVTASSEFDVQRPYQQTRGAKPGMGGRAKSF